MILITKTGVRTGTPKDYRPITLLPLLGKLMEKVVARMIDWIVHNMNEMSASQYGFESGKSTEMAIGDSVDNIQEEIQRQICTSRVFRYKRGFRLAGQSISPGISAVLSN